MATVLGKILKGVGKAVSTGLGAVSKIVPNTTVGKVTGFVSKIIAPKQEQKQSAVVSAVIKTANAVVKQPDSGGVKVEPMPNVTESALTGIQKKVFTETNNLQAQASVTFGKDAAVKSGKLENMNSSAVDVSGKESKTPWGWIAGIGAAVVGLLIWIFSRKRKR